MTAAVSADGAMCRPSMACRTRAGKPTGVTKMHRMEREAPIEGGHHDDAPPCFRHIAGSRLREIHCVHKCGWLPLPISVGVGRLLVRRMLSFRLECQPLKRPFAPILLAALVLVGCGSSDGPSKSSSTSAASSAVAPPTSSAPATTSAADANAAVCGEVQNYIVDTVKPTFNGWDIENDEFDPKVGKALRREATKLFSFEAKATGSPASAIHDEATGLVNLSIGIEEMDDDALGTASNAANGALANLRGVCNF